jgi:hypothetical protein
MEGARRGNPGEAVPGSETTVTPAQAVGEEVIPAPTAALCDVVGNVGRDHAWETGHDNEEHGKHAEHLSAVSPSDFLAPVSLVGNKVAGMAC